MDILIGIFGGGLISFIVTYILGNQQLKDLKQLHRRQLDLKHDLHIQQLSHDRDIANLILSSMRYKEEHRAHPLPFIGKDMKLIIHEIRPDTGHPDDTTDLFSWDTQNDDLDSLQDFARRISE